MQSSAARYITPNPEVVFKKSPDYKPTYMDRVKNYPAIRARLRDFMEIKRHNPMQPVGSSDKLFSGEGKFSNAVPGLRHAHLTFDLSVVYRVEGKNPTVVYLYGFYTHDDLGTGQPSNRNRQSSMSARFQSSTFVE